MSTTTTKSTKSTKSARNSRFQRGSGAYRCDCCTRLTRETGEQSMGSRLCPQCWTIAGLENEISDGYATLAEHAPRMLALLAEIREKGGTVNGDACSYSEADLRDASAPRVQSRSVVRVIVEEVDANGKTSDRFFEITTSEHAQPGDAVSEAQRLVADAARRAKRSK